MTCIVNLLPVLRQRAVPFVLRRGSLFERLPGTSSSFVGTVGRTSVSATRMGKPKVVFVLGPPGSGKGTQCEKIVAKYGYTHLSAGDLLREERNREGSEYGQLIEEAIRDGRIVPVAITCALLENAMNKTQEATGNDRFLIDGFPRNEDNLEGWTKKMSDKVDLQFVLFFECTEQQCTDRCLKRGESSGRSDDNAESLKKRFNTYIHDSVPIIKHYDQQQLVKKIDASVGPDAVFESVKTAFEQQL
ncbi:UMP-CMP kinase [Anopheles bellator]|uniref:UMP-CMP kinase n=1 Tax=Anopheles bellator TaxID=139047 RepID=UPI0026493961|nr:UMP-CMP kinase [Anopheles bellator]